jgi:hypothetical protein
VLFGFVPLMVYLPAMFACVAGAGFDDDVVEEEVVFELVLWLDGVDVFELLDDLQPSTATMKRMKPIACARCARFMIGAPEIRFEGALLSLLTHFLSMKTSMSIVAALASMLL